MKDNQQSNVLKFDVRVGHAKVTVEGRTQGEAIEEARRRLCLEMPRMWDVIQSLDASKFEVAPAA